VDQYKDVIPKNRKAKSKKIHHLYNTIFNEKLPVEKNIFLFIRDNLESSNKKNEDQKSQKASPSSPKEETKVLIQPKNSSKKAKEIFSEKQGWVIITTPKASKHKPSKLPPKAENSSKPGLFEHADFKECTQEFIK